MIAILDYGLGNVGAFFNMYREMNIPAKIVKTSSELQEAKKIIMPGVGAFDLAMNLFKNSSLYHEVSERVLVKKIPVLGICVGMQMLAESSEEGQEKGLGWIPGEVRRINETKLSHKTRLPHMGWNDVEVKNLALFKGLEKDAKFYFLHSYYFDAVHEQNVLAKVEYGETFPCAVGLENVFGVQFHPEKSHHYGSRLLKNFAEI